MSSAKEVAFAGKPSVTNPNTKEESTDKKEHHDRTQAQKEEKKKKKTGASSSVRAEDTNWRR